MNIDELEPKIETKEETLESYNDFKKRYYIYRADEIRGFLQRDGTELNELYEENDKMYEQLKDFLDSSQQRLLSKYSDNWIDIINTEVDELTKYILNDFEEER